MYTFYVRNTSSSSLVCNTCRNDICIDQSLRKIYAKYYIDFVDAKSSFVRRSHETNAAAATAMKFSLECRYESWMIDMPPAAGTSSDRFVLERQFCDMIGATESYRYARNGGSKSNSQFICSQRSRKRPQSSSKRQKESSKQYNCGGSISFSYSGKAKLSITVKHAVMHERCETKMALSVPAISRVSQLTESGLAPFQICTILRKEFATPFQYNNVYYCWLESIGSMFKRGKDSKLSADQFLIDSKEFQTIWEQKEPYGTGFLTNLGKQLSAKVPIREVFIDSTYKTNKEKLELFALIGSVMGTGFPLAYMLLESSSTTFSDCPTRQQSICLFLSSVRAFLPSLKPSFSPTKTRGN